MQTLLMSVALVAAAAAAAWFDIRERRIPNALTLGALAAALLLRVPLGMGAVGDGFAGAFLAFGLALPFFLVGGLGGGDLKFLVAVGAFLGPGRLFFALLITAVVGAAMAFAAMLRHRALRQTAVNVHTLVTTFSWRSFGGWKREANMPFTIHSSAVITVPYGVAIAAGALTAWFVYTANPGWSLMATLAG